MMVLLVATVASSAMGEERRISPPQPLKLSTALGPAYPLGKAGDFWAMLIRERSGGRLAVEHFPGATLSSRDSTREFVALRERTVELAVGSALSWSAQVPQLNVIALPWLVAGEQELQALIDGETGKRLSAELERSGVVAAAWAADGFIEIASKVPLRQPADVAGLKIRTRALPLLEETLAALGARPTAMSLADARSALEYGQLDAQETSVAGYSVSRLQAGPLTHLQVWRAHADALVFAVNRSVWEAWSDAERQLVRDAAVEASRQTRKMAERLADDAALAKLDAQGVRVTRLTPAGRAAFRDAVRAVYDRWTPIVGSELLEAAEADISAAQARR